LIGLAQSEGLEIVLCQFARIDGEHILANRARLEIFLCLGKAPLRLCHKPLEGLKGYGEYMVKELKRHVFLLEELGIYFLRML